MTVITAMPVDITATGEGTAIPDGTFVATFSDDNPGASASDFNATIDWGDGSSATAGFIGVTEPNFFVAGGHTYADEGTFTVTVTINDNPPGSGTATATDTATVPEVDSISASGVFVHSGTTTVTNAVVANFSDSFANVAGDFTAGIDWGDGTVTPGTVAGAGPFSVTGSHTYATNGQFTVTTTVSDDAPGTASATVTSPARVALSPPPFYDFNNDGRSDLVFQNTTAQPQIWLMNGQSVISKTMLTTPPAQWAIVGAADFDGDGSADLLWLNTLNNTPAIWDMNGASLVASADLPAPPPSWRIAGFGDTFGDGHAEIIWQNSDGTPAIWQMNGFYGRERGGAYGAAAAVADRRHRRLQRRRQDRFAVHQHAQQPAGDLGDERG